MCFFLNVFFPLSSRRVRFESVTALKYGTWFLDEQDTRQNTELKKSVVQRVSIHLSYLFLYILTSKFIKKLKKKKKLSKQKKFKHWILLNQMRTEKQMRAAALRHRICFFLSLTIQHAQKWIRWRFTNPKIYTPKYIEMALNLWPLRRVSLQYPLTDA